VSDFTVTLRPRAVRDLEGLAQTSRKQVLLTLENLGVDFRPHGSRRLWLRRAYAIADLDNEIFYTIDVNLSVVCVVTIQPLRAASDELEANNTA
jgi:mRNA-degrading endonuclease RelE of RelBE toxin-antitoxin system